MMDDSSQAQAKGATSRVKKQKNACFLGFSASRSLKICGSERDELLIKLINVKNQKYASPVFQSNNPIQRLVTPTSGITQNIYSLTWVQSSQILKTLRCIFI